MTKFFTTRSVLTVTGLMLMVGIFAFGGKNCDPSPLEAAECRVSIDNQEEKELFWESLSRQFSGSTSTY